MRGVGKGGGGDVEGKRVDTIDVRTEYRARTVVESYCMAFCLGLPPFYALAV